MHAFSYNLSLRIVIPVRYLAGKGLKFFSKLITLTSPFFPLLFPLPLGEKE